jgi:hypothetical protein
VRQSEIKKFASWLGKQSFKARVERLGLEHIREIARENGKRGGRPKGSSKRGRKQWRSISAAQSSSTNLSGTATSSGKSTKQSNKRTAEQVEAAQKASLAKGEVGIRDRAPVPTLRKVSENAREGDWVNRRSGSYPTISATPA